MAGLSLALGSVSPGLAYEVVEHSPDDEPVATDNSEYQELSNRFLSTTTEMWFLLSGIASRCRSSAICRAGQAHIRAG